MFSLSFPSCGFCRPARHGSPLTVPRFVHAREDSFSAKNSSAPQGPSAKNMKTAAVTVSPTVREPVGREGQKQLVAGGIRGTARALFSSSPQLCSAQTTASTPPACPPVCLPAPTQMGTVRASAPKSPPRARRAASVDLATCSTRTPVCTETNVAARMLRVTSSR